MKKKLLLLSAFMLASATQFAIREGVGPAITGSTANGSWVDVRVTANVVDSIAVNEASPIDFGNLVRDTNNANIYASLERIDAITPGVVTYRSAKDATGTSFKTYLDRDNLDLDWHSFSGKEDTETRTVIGNVKVEGIKVATDANGGDNVNMATGMARKTLTAHFYAYDSALAGASASTADTTNGNLGQHQKLGNYEGTVRVYAEYAATAPKP